MFTIRASVSRTWPALLLAALGPLGCGPSIDGMGIVGVNGAVDGELARRNAFQAALQYERWDEAIRLTEEWCASGGGGLTGNKSTQCLYQTVEAYEKRAYAHARGQQWDSAIQDELRANEAADNLVVANSEFDQKLRSGGAPETIVQMQIKTNADQTARTKAVAQVRLDAYRNHAMPDQTAMLVAQTSGIFTPYSGKSADAAAQPAPSGFVAASPQPRSYALIIGIEGYRDIPAATGARSDAQRFAQLAKETLGIDDANVKLALDGRATRTDILGALGWLKDNVPSGARVYFYYSGHGSPAADKSTYLVPYDGDAKNVVATGISMSEIMRGLAATKARDVLAVVDACFSGAGGRSVLPPGARPLMRVKDTTPGRQIALYTASGADEISGLAPGERAGLFTKLVTTGLGTAQADADGDGQISLQELADWVGPRVAREAKKDSREQHPTLILGSGVGAASNFVVEYGLPKAK